MRPYAVSLQFLLTSFPKAHEDLKAKSSMDQLDEKLPPEARDTLYLILAFAKESLPSRLAN